MHDIVGWMCRSCWAQKCGDAAVGAASKVRETLRDEAYDTGMSLIKGLPHPMMGGSKDRLGVHRKNMVHETQYGGIGAVRTTVMHTGDMLCSIGKSR